VDEFEIRTRAEYERALRRFSYPLVVTPGDEALDAFEDLKAQRKGVPIVLGGVSAFTLVDEMMANGLIEHPSTQLILDRAAEITFPEGYQAMRARERAAIRRRYPQFAHNEDDSLPIGEWPDQAQTGGGLSAAYHWSGQPWPRVHIALLPTDDWTTAPAHLRAGGWNACPEAAVMVSALRSWRDRYGAELVGLAHDVMNIRVDIPPSSRDEALALAWEHYLFCSDALNEATLAELGAALIADDWWSFWWD
jgi:Domain of unknown function (DUF4253)